MSDLIDRQAAIDFVYSETVSTNPEHFKSSEKFIKFMDDADIASFGKWQWANGFNTALVATTIQLEKFPSVQPERKKGKWIETTQGDHYKCSCCGVRSAFWFDEENSSSWEKDMSEWLSGYCPNCGADMRGGKDG